MILGSTTPSYGQYTPDTFSEEQLELLESIKGDLELYEYYTSGVRKLKWGKIWGITSLSFIGTTIVGMAIMAQAPANSYLTDNPYFIGFSMFLLSIPLACITGTKALLTRRNGRKRIRNAFDAARGDLNSEYYDYYGGLEIQSTNNGFGLVYSF